MVGRSLLCLLLAALCAGAQAETLCIEPGRTLTAAGEPFDGGRIIVRDGKVTAAGKDVKRPAFSRLISARDMVVTPGFILPMTALATPDPPPSPPGDGVRVEIKPDQKAADEALFRAEALRQMLEQGITIAGLTPASREAGISGVACAVSTRGGTRGEALVQEDAALVVTAMTPEPWRRQVAAAFAKADAAREERERKKRRGQETKGDPSAIENALTKKKPVLLMASTHALLGAAADAMPLHLLDVTVLDGTDLWWEAGAVKKQGLRVMTYPTITRQRNTRYPVNRAAEWHHAGVKIAFVLPSDSATGIARHRDAVIGLVEAGLPASVALSALTSEAAAALGVADIAGSIREGRRADLLFWSADPFDPTARLLRVMVGGAFVDRADPAEIR